MSFPAWEQARSCTGGPTPGAKALMAGSLEAYAGSGATNLGIYNCRTVRGGTTTSCHGEGRACDVGFPLRGGRANPAGTRLVEALLPSVARLGIQAIIWNRTIWSARSPQGRPYTGVAPHFDHVHVELTREAGRILTLATVRKALRGGAVRDLPETPPEQPLLRVGDRGAAVSYLQRFLGVDVDGIFGPLTEASVIRFQKRAGLDADGVVGPFTWAAITALVPV